MIWLQFRPFSTILGVGGYQRSDNRQDKKIARLNIRHIQKEQKRNKILPKRTNHGWKSTDFSFLHRRRNPRNENREKICEFAKNKGEEKIYSCVKMLLYCVIINFNCEKIIFNCEETGRFDAFRFRFDAFRFRHDAIKFFPLAVIFFFLALFLFFLALFSRELGLRDGEMRSIFHKVAIH